MNSSKYIGIDLHKDSISVAVRNPAGKIVMESLIETKAGMILQLSTGCAGICTSPLKKELRRPGSTTF